MTTEQEDIDPLDRLRRVLADLGANADGVVGRLYRLDKEGSRTGKFLTDIAPEDFSLMDVKNRYGGGYYRVRFTAPNGELVANPSFAIDGAPLPVDPPKIQPMFHVEQQPQQKAVPEYGPLEALVKAQGELLARIADRLAMQAAPPPPPAPAPFGIAEITGLISAVQPLFAATRQAAPDMTEALLKGINLGKELAGIAPSPREDEDVMGVISKGIDAFAPLLAGIGHQATANAGSGQVTSHTDRQANNRAPRVQNSFPPPSIAKSANSLPKNELQSASPTPQTVNGGQMTLNQILSEIKSHIDAGKSPEQAAEAMHAVMAPYLSQVPPNVVPQLVAYDSSFAPYQPWLAAYLEALRDRPWDESDDIDSEPAV